MPFLSLPPELLRAICQYLEDSELRSFRLVSHYTAGLAKPILLDQFIQLRHRTWPFVQLLTKDPRCADYVRCLHITLLRGESGNEIIAADNDFQLFADQVRHLQDRASKVLGDLPSPTESPPPRDGLKQQEVIATWLMVHLVKLEVLSIAPDNAWSFDLLQHFIAHDRGIFAYLHTLHVRAHPWRLFSLVPLKPIEPLVNFSGLNTIVLHRCVDLRDFSGRTVAAQHIEHYPCTREVCQIGILLSVCTNLTSYELEYVGPRALDLSYLCHAQTSLVRLALKTPDFSPTDLHQFVALTDVIVSVAPLEVWRKDVLERIRRPVAQRTTASPYLLAETLPRSLERLTLIGDSPEAEACCQDQLEFIISNALANFSRLKVVEASWQVKQHLRDLLQSAGIELRT